jgi:DNA-binding NarL/FixJ family response regulator
VRVLLADAQFLIRRGVASVLGETFPDWSFLHSCCFEQVMEQLDPGTAGIGLVIIDLDLPGMNGSTGIRILREACPAPRIALLTGSDDWNTILNCLAAGVHGYLLKAEASEQLVPAMQTLMSGGVYVPPRRPEQGPTGSCMVASVMAGLTARQQEVLTLLVDGQSTKDIAKRLNLGLGTVKVHLGGIYRTLAVRNRAEAAARLRTAARLTA